MYRYPVSKYHLTFSKSVAVCPNTAYALQGRGFKLVLRSRAVIDWRSDVTSLAESAI